MLVAPAASMAGTSSVPMTVTASIQRTCNVVGAPTIDFGSNNLNGAQTNIQVNCSANTPYSIELSAGNNAQTDGLRRMKEGSGSATLPYQLYKDASDTQAWGGPAEPQIGTAVSNTGTGANQQYTIYGALKGNGPQDPSSYTDTVQIVLNF